MNALNSIFGPDSPAALKFSLIFLIIAISLFLLWIIFMKIVKTMKRGVFSSRSRQPRLGILEDTEVDAERRLILIRRDNAEHLLLIGGKNDIVIENNINRAILTTPPPLPQTNYTPLETNEQNSGYRISAKTQARSAAQIQSDSPSTLIPKVILEPKSTPESKTLEITPEPKNDFGEKVTQVFKAPAVSPIASPTPTPTLSMRPISPIETNPFTPGRQSDPLPQRTSETPRRLDPPLFSAPHSKPAIEKPIPRNNDSSIQDVKPQNATTFDSLEDELASLLGQKKPN